MGNRMPMGVGEWYHCYNRGVDKRKVFETARDYERFLELLYVSNGSNPIHLSNFRNKNLSQILKDEQINRGDPIVELGGYCLMPNHVHFVMKEIKSGGIGRFMQKVFTGYTMYFNKKKNRTGALFGGVFKSKHLYNDIYLKHALAYTYLNPVELFEPRWKEGHGQLQKIKKFLKKYEYSSFADVINFTRPHRKLIGNEIFQMYEKQVHIDQLLKDAQVYYASLRQGETLPQ